MASGIRTLFSPAIRLMNRLNYPRKFAVLGSMVLFAFVVVVYNLYTSLSADIRAARHELEGIARIRTLTHAVQVLQKHRGLAAGELGGVVAMQPEREAREAQVTAAFDTLVQELPRDLITSRDFFEIRTEWERLRIQGRGWSPEINFEVHTRLIEHLLNFEADVADRYLLTLDPEAASYYLIDSSVNKLPATIERLGRVRAFGTVILAAGSATTQQVIEMSALVAELDAARKSASYNIEKTGRYNPSLQETVSRSAVDIADSLGSIVRQVETQLLASSGQTALSPQVFYDGTTAAIDRIYRQIEQSLLPTAEDLIRQRIDRLDRALYTILGVAFALLAAAAYCTIGGYFAITRTVAGLAASAHALAGGDLKVRIRPDSQDELAQVAASFNEMADGLTGLMAAREEDEARMRAIIESALDAVVQMNADGLITGWNPQAERIFGWSRTEVLGRPMHDVIIPPEFRDAHVRGLKHFLAVGQGPVLNKRIQISGRHRVGHDIPIELTISANMHRGTYEFSAFIRDITEQKRTEELIWTQANYDVLTQLPNRRMFRDRLEQELRKSHRSGRPMVLMFIDLDRFKDVNDAFGHQTGDLVLIEAARRITACVRESDTVARLGGDEFTVILSEQDDAAGTERIAGDVLRALQAPFELGHAHAHLSASIGITVYPQDGTDADSLIRNADQAMYGAKDAGRDRFNYFVSSMQEAALKRQQLVQDLRTAVDNDQFVLHYQPIISLSSGRIHKAEALLRWMHPERGLVSPADFIPLAEETGLIVPIGDRVFREATRQLLHWRARYAPELQMGVNMSPAQFARSEGHANWVAHIEALGLPGDSVVIEITESLLLDASSSVSRQLQKFREAGMKISIDDFGTGYSALSYLTKFDMDYLKIDQSFVRNMTVDPSGTALPEAIVLLAHKLGIEVVAEGVETATQRDILDGLGCDYAQGYLFAKPLPAAEFEALLRVQRASPHSFAQMMGVS